VSGRVLKIVAFIELLPVEKNCHLYGCRYNLVDMNIDVGSVLTYFKI